jgi:protein O-mannosyl-transferase
MEFATVARLMRNEQQARAARDPADANGAVSGNGEILRLRPAFAGALLVLLVFLAYLPALQNGFIWDDDAHLTENPCIVGALGFKGIWTSSAATYYPLVLSSFWVQHAIWGLRPMPYHLVNIAFHATNAVLLWLVLRHLKVRGAWLGAAIWGLHPVLAESVAWVTELKNTQSCLFYLLAIWFFLKWRTAGALAGRPGTERHYFLAWFCAVLAILSKASTVMLPVVLGLVWWWNEGRWRWRNILRLAPFFLISAAASGWTVWEQQFHSGAAGPEWSQSRLERLVIAGKAVWFYLGKLLWPHPLIFIYPRWDINATHPTAYLPVLASGIVLFVLWRGRRGWAGPLFFAFVYFMVSLFPVLGFFNVYFFRYSFVSDHFQYLASPGPIALAAAGMATAFAFLNRSRFFLEPVLGGTLLLALGLLTWRHCGTFANPEILWQATLARNPACWMAHSNLGLLRKNQGRLDEAIEHYHQALRINPDAWDALNDLGAALVAQGRFDEAIECYRQSLRTDPTRFAVQNNLGHALAGEGRFEEAIECYRQALRLNPDYADALNNLGVALTSRGRLDEAIENYRRAIRLNPAFSGALNNLGVTLVNKGQLAEATGCYQQALRINPRDYNALNNLGVALASQGQFDEAIRSYRRALQIKPNDPRTMFNLSKTLAAKAQLDGATQSQPPASEVNSNKLDVH